MIQNPPMKKVVLLNCLAVFALFNVCVLLISCAKKKAEEIREADASPSKPAAEVPVKPTKFTPQMVVAAFEKAAGRMPPDLKAEMMKEIPLKDPAKMAEMTEYVNAELANGKMELKEISVDALADFINKQSSSGGLAKAKANRIKCVNNLGNVYKSLLAFAQDNGERLPWQLTPAGVRNHLDASVVANSNFGRAAGVDNLMFMHQKVFSVGGVFGMTAMKAELQTPKILVSPCDKGRFAANEKVQEDWRNYNTKGGKPIPHDGLSYGLCFGGDFQRPATVVAMTRNLSTDDLATAGWVGAEDANRGMAGLQVGQGQVVRADGSASQSINADLGANGGIIKAHINARGGTSPLGASRTGVILPY